jgi:NAD-dependent dihydropyrimidine dehydrogenase PreA subunit
MVLIDEDLCTGCGDCVPSCAEGAIQIIDGKAKLVADNLCDGLGACLGDCPEGAISVVEREAEEYDEHAVERHLQNLKKKEDHAHTPAAKPHGPHDGAPAACGCPGSLMMKFDEPAAGPAAAEGVSGPSALRQWPIQLHLVSPTAPYFQGADVLLAADCTAFAMGGFHNDHLKGKSLAVACPKLDQGQDVYLQKLVAMIDQSKINTLTVMIMEVPCCAGLAQLASRAVSMAGRKVPLKKVTVGLRGEVLGEDWV